MECGLLGKKLGHSYSKIIHEKLSLYSYDLIELSEEELAPFILKKDFKGLNVTIPYKELCMKSLDYIDEHAKSIGCVNTIVNKEGKLYGYNTDYFGLKALVLQSGVDFNGKKVLILGTGGTSKTAKAVFRDLGAEAIYNVSRREENGNISYETAITKHSDADYIINTTPVGMYPNMDNSPIDLSSFSKLKGVTDVIYNPAVTKLMESADKLGIFNNGGLYMLVVQAVKACELFMDVKIEDTKIAEIYEAVKKETSL